MSNKIYVDVDYDGVCLTENGESTRIYDNQWGVGSALVDWLIDHDFEAELREIY